MNGAAGLFALALLAAGADDPRIPLVESQLANRHELALREVERLLAGEREQAQRLGLDYLRGRLLDRLESSQEATDAFLEALSATPWLSLYSHYQLAVEYERRGHPEMAAGLVAKVVANGRDFPLLPDATRLLRRSLAGGGDCRVLNGIREAHLPRSERREVALARGACAFRRDEDERAREGLVALLEEERGDDVARQAAELLAARLPAPRRSRPSRADAELLELVGLTFHQHRQFARSSRLLDRVLEPLNRSSRRLRDEELDSYYARVRNDFWQGQYLVAAAGFARLAEHTADPPRRADALYQQGRSLELAGNWQSASASFRQAYLADPRGTWGAAGLLAALRLEWRSGREDTALELYQLLETQAPARDLVARAALFMAASDLVRGRGDRAGLWLAQAERANGVSAGELAYWKGRLAEVREDASGAVAAYLEVLRQEAHHPFALEARQRLESPELTAPAESLGLRLAASGRTDDLVGAWLLLGEDHPRGRMALTSLALRLRRDRQAGPYLQLSPVPVEEWRLWQQELQGAEERLLALGLWREGAPAVSRHFPLREPRLAFTGSLHLAAAGESRRALVMVEILDQGRPPWLPDRLLPEALRQLLFPLPFQELITTAAARRGIDPFLLAAIIREESRFDPQALSAAAARGLTQMTQPTAQRFAQAVGRREIAADDLYRPEISIPLGAAYLAELTDFFRGVDHAVVAAYNAGEDQARLWQSHCFSREPAEYLSKIGFRQTRRYVQKVLTSREHYRELYGLGPRLEVTAASGE